MAGSGKETRRRYRVTSCQGCMMPPWLSRVLVALLPPPVPFQTTFPPRGLRSRLGVWGRTCAGAPTEITRNRPVGETRLLSPFIPSATYTDQSGTVDALFLFRVGIQF